MSTPARGTGAGGAESIRVGLGERAYDIVVGRGLLDTAGARVAETLGPARLVVVTDETVAGLHLSRLSASLSGAGVGHETIVLPPGEHTKSFEQIEALCGQVLDMAIDRDAALLALGGGVVGDVAGFAAAVLLRGIRFVQVPTTLLAQVDSSVGGKTGINMPAGKNLIGAFHQPSLVLADTAVLDTLPPRQMLAGYAETVKYGLIGDPDFFAWCEANGAALIAGDHDARRYAVLKGCAAKAEIVAADEREAGRRALLNLGHTFGHALEAEAGYGDALLHGEAVAIGIVTAFDLSVRLGLCPPGDAERLRRHFTEVGLTTGVAGLACPHGAWRADALMAHMEKDKKVRAGRMTFVLARGIGDAFITRDVSRDDVSGALDRLLAA